MWDLHAITHCGPSWSVEEGCPNYIWSNLVSIMRFLSLSLTEKQGFINIIINHFSGRKIKSRLWVLHRVEIFLEFLKWRGRLTSNFHSHWQLKEPYFGDQYSWGLPIDSCLCMSGFFFSFFFQSAAWCMRTHRGFIVWRLLLTWMQQWLLHSNTAETSSMDGAKRLWWLANFCQVRSQQTKCFILHQTVCLRCTWWIVAVLRRWSCWPGKNL